MTKRSEARYRRAVERNVAAQQRDRSKYMTPGNEFDALMRVGIRRSDIYEFEGGRLFDWRADAIKAAKAVIKGVQ